MGLEDREWFREPKPDRPVRITLPMGLLIVAGVVLGLAGVVGVRTLAQGKAATYGAPLHTHSGATTISLLPGLPGIKIGGDALYAKGDPWKDYLAPESVCPGGENTDAPLQAQAETMVCLVDYARRKRGLGPVSPIGLLNQSSVAKAEKIARCSDFNHDACGEDAAADMRGLGYQGAWGENLYIAGGRYGAPRPALDGWLNSPGHRENLFRPEWRTEGIAVQKMDRFGREKDMTLWVNQFGDR